MEMELKKELVIKYGEFEFSESENINPSQKKYLMGIMDKFYIIDRGIDSIKHIKTLLLIGKYPSEFKMESFFLDKYYEHQIENFQIRCISVVDYIVLFLNFALRLGVPEKKCNVYTVIENENYSDSELVKILNRLNTELNGSSPKLVES
jgi:hypothetical protein